MSGAFDKDKSKWREETAIGGAQLGFCTCFSVTTGEMKITCMRLASTSKLVLLLALCQGVWGKPLDEQRIYFPGEQYQESLDTRSYGRDQSPYRAYKDGGSNYMHGAHHHYSSHQTPHQLSEISQDQLKSYEVDYRPKSEQQYNLAEIASGENQYGGIQQTRLHHKLASQRPVKSTSTYTAAHGSYEQGVPKVTSSQLEEQRREDNIQKKSYLSQAGFSGGNQANDGLTHTSKKNESYHLNPYQTQNDERSRQLPEDLNVIINQHLHNNMHSNQHELHPNVKQAIDNIMQDLERPAIQKEDQKKQHGFYRNLKEQNNNEFLGNSMQVQSTKVKGEINLSELLNQLHQLEQSPSHRNITWCEEKIKAFLEALRYKQENGVIIDQKVQEDTLHQILISDMNNESEKGEVYEPPFKKETIKPLGGDFLQGHNSQQQSEYTYKHELYNHDSHGLGEKTNDNAQNLLTTEQSYIVSGVPEQDQKLLLDILSHKYQHESQSPPFTSENSAPEHLNPELPGPMQGETQDVSVSYGGNENIEEFQNNAIPQKGPAVDVDKTEEKLNQIIRNTEEQHQDRQVGESEGSFHKGSAFFNMTEEVKEDNEHGVPSLPDPNTPEGFQPRPVGQLDLELPEYPLETDPNTPEGFQPRPLGQLDLQLPEYHTSHEASIEKYDSNGGISSHHSENNVLHNILTHQESLEHNTIEHQVHGRPHVEQEGENIEVSSSNHSNESTSTNNASQEQARQEEMNQEYINNLNNQQVNYETLIEELVQIETLPGHQAIDKCQEKILEFLEILKYQQELGFGNNQQELARLHQTMIEQTEKYSQHNHHETTSSAPTSFWRKLQKKIRTTYEKAKNTAKKAVGY